MRPCSAGCQRGVAPEPRRAGRYGVVDPHGTRHRQPVYKGILQVAPRRELVILIEFGLITCMGVVNPLFAAYRLEHNATERVARTLSAWSITSSATIAAMTVLWKLLASVIGPHAAIAIAGVLILITPVLVRGCGVGELT